MLGSAFVLLGMAGLMASDEGLREIAGYLYPAGVSLYSVALILYPSVWMGQRGATLRAVILFAVAGWVGSAMGIGMAQDLKAVPKAFVIGAGVVMVIPGLWNTLKNRKREVMLCVVVGGVCLVWSQMGEETTVDDDSDRIAVGREACW